MRSAIRRRAVACGAMAFWGGAALGLWLGVCAAGLPPGAFAVCSAAVLIGAAWLTGGLPILRLAASLLAAAGLGAGWGVAAWCTGRPLDAVLFATLHAALLLAAAVAAHRHGGAAGAAT